MAKKETSRQSLSFEFFANLRRFYEENKPAIRKHYTPFDTPRLMRELIQWTNDTFKDRFLHPIITIGVFIVHFLSIHPFTDGNGRMSRALTVLLMLRNNYGYSPAS